MARGKRPVPFRTRKLSLSAPMVLPWRRGGRVGRRRTTITERGSEPRALTPVRVCVRFHAVGGLLRVRRQSKRYSRSHDRSTTRFRWSARKPRLPGRTQPGKPAGFRAGAARAAALQRRIRPRRRGPRVTATRVRAGTAARTTPSRDERPAAPGRPSFGGGPSGQRPRGRTIARRVTVRSGAGASAGRRRAAGRTVARRVTARPVTVRSGRTVVRRVTVRGRSPQRPAARRCSGWQDRRPQGDRPTGDRPQWQDRRPQGDRPPATGRSARSPAVGRTVVRRVTARPGTGRSGRTVVRRVTVPTGDRPQRVAGPPSAG